RLYVKKVNKDRVEIILPLDIIEFNKIERIERLQHESDKDEEEWKLVTCAKENWFLLAENSIDAEFKTIVVNGLSNKRTYCVRVIVYHGGLENWIVYSQNEIDAKAIQPQRRFREPDQGQPRQPGTVKDLKVGEMGSEFSTLVDTNKYWTKCVLALKVHGQKALLRVFHNDIGGNYAGLPKDPAQLYNFFNQPKNRKILNKLKSSKTLKQDQFDLILPPNSNLCNSNLFDIILIVLLVISFVNIPAPLGGWKKVPKANDQSLAAFVVLIRNLMNLVLHSSLKDSDEPYFKKIWKDIKDCLIGLQYDQTMLQDFDEL
uniref:DZIP3-like HEPN domain-containing protein n=1 Tax=Clytia hemisphaerica TaxID=252671 RepID=A0A7M5URR8_9CNID